MVCESASTTERRDQKSHFNCHFDLFCMNFFWVIAIGVGWLCWIGSYTDYLKPVVSLLGLGGIFAWVAFFFDIIREERKDQLRMKFEKLLELKWTCVALAIVTIVSLLLTSLFGNITIDSGRDTLDRYVEIRRTSRPGSSLTSSPVARAT